MRHPFIFLFLYLLIFFLGENNQSFACSPRCLPIFDSDEETPELRIKAPIESKDTTANKTAYKVLDFSKISGKEIIPWGSLESFVKDNPTSIMWAAEECCPKCENKIILIHYSSPEDSWKNLAGRDGVLSICPHCMTQLEFFILKMN